MDICSSPKLFAAYRVLHRLLVPRYSPYALCSLTLLFQLNFVLLRYVFMTFLVLLVYLYNIFFGILVNLN